MPIKFEDFSLYTIQEIAVKLGVNEETVRRKIRSGDLVSQKIGKTSYISNESLRDFFNRGKIQRRKRKE